MNIAQTINKGKTDVMVAPVVTYTTDTTYAAFVDNAVNGEVGVYLASTNTIRTNLVPLVAGDKFFIAQKFNDEVFKTITMTFNTNDVTTQNFLARVAQVLTATVTGTASAKGETHTLRVIEDNLMPDEQVRSTQEFITLTGSETATAIATGIFANYTLEESIKTLKNQGVPAGYTITNPSAGVLTITAKNAEILLNASFADDAVGTVVVATPWGKGYGYGEDIVNLEAEGSVFNGHLRNTERKFEYTGNRNPFAVASATYDQITISNTGAFRLSGHSYETFEPEYNLVIAVQTTTAGATGSALYTELKAIGLQ